MGTNFFLPETLDHKLPEGPKQKRTAMLSAEGTVEVNEAAALASEGEDASLEAGVPIDTGD